MNPIDRIEQLQAELARVTAELADELKCKEREQRDFSAICSDRNALRARAAGLEKDRDDWKQRADLARVTAEL